MLKRVAKTSLMLSLVFSGCGYHLRGDSREFFQNHHIRTIYVRPVNNNSYKGGVEITLYNALRKRIAQGGYVRVVDQVSDADAQINAVIQEASYGMAADTSVDQIAPTQQGPSNIRIASLYEARLRVTFDLQDKRNKSLWGDDLTRTKRFAASTYYGAAGSTSALINESEFERSLGDLSVSIVADAEESINSLF